MFLSWGIVAKPEPLPNLS